MTFSLKHYFLFLIYLLCVGFFSYSVLGIVCIFLIVFKIISLIFYKLFNTSHFKQLYTVIYCMLVETFALFIMCLYYLLTSNSILYVQYFDLLMTLLFIQLFIGLFFYLAYSFHKSVFSRWKYGQLGMIVSSVIALLATQLIMGLSFFFILSMIFNYTYYL